MAKLIRGARMLKAIVLAGLMGTVLMTQASVAFARADVKVRKVSPGLKKSTKAQVKTVELVYPELSVEQMAVSRRVITGKTPCELGSTVSISPHSQSAGRFLLEMGREKYEMEPVLTTTGAVRLEDAKSGAVWLQLANKSMLMNQKHGKRLADACMNADQIKVALDMERSPPPGLLDQK